MSQKVCWLSYSSMSVFNMGMSILVMRLILVLIIFRIWCLGLGTK